MRILIWSANPNSQTGYGTAVRNLSSILSKKHTVAIHSFAGAGDHDEVTSSGVPIFFNPQMGTPVVNWLRHYAKKFKPDLILSWFDLWLIPWLGDEISSDLGSKFVGYVPIDSIPLSPYYKAVLPAIRKVIPMCWWGKGVAEEAGVKCDEPIYHGVDTGIYYPRDKALSRQKLGIRDDAFVFLFIGTNFDVRKNIPNTMLAFKMFLDRVPQARNDTCMVLHTDPYGVDAGYNLVELWNTLGGDPANMIFTRVENYRTGTPEENIATRYAAADITVLCSLAEGFGFTPLEAAACGTPSIVTNYGVLSEVWKGRSLLVDTVDYFATQRQLNFYVIPSTRKLSEAMEEAWRYRKQTKKLGERALRFARTLDWKIIGNQWLDRIDAIGDELQDHPTAMGHFTWGE